MTTYLGPLNEAVLEQSAVLEKRATACKKEGDWGGALAALRKVKALHGGLYQSTRLAKFLQQAGHLDEALQEIQWLVKHSQQWVKTMFAHQPAAVLQRQRVGWLVRVYSDAVLICKRAKRTDLQAEHEQKRAAYASLLEKLEPVADAERAALSKGWSRQERTGRRQWAHFRQRAQNALSATSNRKRGSETMFKQAIFLTAALLVAPAWAINKCTGADGKVAFQDAPCAGKGEKLDVRPASGAARTSVPTPTAHAMPLTNAPAPLPTAPALPVQPAPVANKSPMAREADECLAWYRPKLRDPAGAYYTEPSKDGRTLSMTIHATNGYGGYVTQRGSCDFNNGKLDSDWTNIHATRDGW